MHFIKFYAALRVNQVGRVYQLQGFLTNYGPSCIKKMLSNVEG